MSTDNGDGRVTSLVGEAGEVMAGVPDAGVAPGGCTCPGCTGPTAVDSSTACGSYREGSWRTKPGWGRTPGGSHGEVSAA